MRLSEFDFDIEYKPGRQHAMADRLSRILTEGLHTKPIYDDIPIVGAASRSAPAVDPRRAVKQAYLHIPSEELVQAQQDTRFVRPVNR